MPLQFAYKAYCWYKKDWFLVAVIYWRCFSLLHPRNRSAPSRKQPTRAARWTRSCRRSETCCRISAKASSTSASNTSTTFRKRSSTPFLKVCFRVQFSLLVAFNLSCILHCKTISVMAGNTAGSSHLEFKVNEAILNRYWVITCRFRRSVGFHQSPYFDGCTRFGVVVWWSEMAVVGSSITLEVSG